MLVDVSWCELMSLGFHTPQFTPRSKWADHQIPIIVSAFGGSSADHSQVDLTIMQHQLLGLTKGLTNTGWFPSEDGNDSDVVWCCLAGGNTMDERFFAAICCLFFKIILWRFQDLIFSGGCAMKDSGGYSKADYIRVQHRHLFNRQLRQTS